jgi:uncharacterized membrane protein
VPPKSPPEEVRTEQLREGIEAALKPLPDTPLKQQVVKQVVEVAESFSGPLAHPEHMAAYEAICPGLADRITKMAETKQARQEDRADFILKNEYADRRLGMWLGFAALLVLVGTGTALTLLGHIWVGGGMLTASVLGAGIVPFILKTAVG